VPRAVSISLSRHADRRSRDLSLICVEGSINLDKVEQRSSLDVPLSALASMVASLFAVPINICIELLIKIFQLFAWKQLAWCGPYRAYFWMSVGVDVTKHIHLEYVGLGFGSCHLIEQQLSIQGLLDRRIEDKFKSIHQF
jgi:hypothetical protein